MRNITSRSLAILLSLSFAFAAMAQSQGPAQGLFQQSPPEPEIRLAQADFEAERQEWERIVGSQNPQDFIRFIEKYPNSVFRSAADAAVLRLPPVADTAPAQQPAPAGQATAPATAPATETPAATVQTAPATGGGTDLAQAVQGELIRVGCLSGRADGDWGRRSEQALSEYSRRKGVSLASLEPSADVLDLLEEETQRICPVSCAVTEVAQGDRCVRKTCDRGEELNRRGECVAVAPPPLRCGPGEVKRGNRCVDAPRPEPKPVVTCGPGERLRGGRCVAVQQPAPRAPVSDGCPRGAKRAKNGHCYFSPFCSPANKGLPGTDVCE